MLRPHSIILASCKPGCKPGFDQVCSQVFDKFVWVYDTLSNSFRLFFVENLVANHSRFAGLCAC